MALFVDRSFAGGTAFFHDKHGFVRPLSRFDEVLVSRLGHEHVGKHVVASGHGAVIHVEAGGKINPIAIIIRAQELIVFRVLGSKRIGRLSAEDNKTANRRYAPEQEGSLHIRLLALSLRLTTVPLP